MRNKNKQMLYAAVKDAYQQIIKENNINNAYIKRRSVIDIIMGMPAPRFYLSPSRASEYVYQYYRGELELTSPQLLEMVEDLVENYERIKTRRTHTQQFFIWKAVVESPAKSFYCTRQTLTNIIFNYGNYGKKSNDSSAT